MRKIWMRNQLWLCLGLATTVLFGTVKPMQAQEPVSSNSSAANSEDKYLWLEDVLGDKAIEWVKARNQTSQSKLEADPSFATLRDDLLAILDSDARIPMISKHGEFYYNFWRDKKNERGLWRRTTLDEYKKTEPKWEILLDLDELGKVEKENWVWSGVSLLRPDYDRALINLSRGGADATVTREFDLKTKAFVADGFSRPESKGSLGWIDRDSVFVQTNFGDDSMTTSGYPRIAKRWQRGTPMTAAETIYDGQSVDLAISAIHDDSPGFERNFISRAIAFYKDELYYLPTNEANANRDRIAPHPQPLSPKTGRGEPTSMWTESKPIKIDAPDSANKSVFHEYLAIELRDPWEVDGQSFKAGSLLITRFDAFLSGDRKLDVVFEPTETTALSSFGFTKNHLFINVLEDVKNKLYVLTPSGNTWTREPLVGSPALGTVNVAAVD